MLIYNTTFHTEDEEHNNFLDFIKNTYIPEAIKSNFLHSPTLSRIFPHYEQRGVSYSLQFKVKNIEVLDLWIENEGKSLHHELKNKFGNKVAGFTTIMEEVEL